MQRWGAAWLLLALFLGSWVGQALTQVALVGDTASEFWAATLENWQSEWLQLLIQAVVLLGFKHQLFKADAEDVERLDRKLNEILEWQRSRDE